MPVNFGPELLPYPQTSDAPDGPGAFLALLQKMVVGGIIPYTTYALMAAPAGFLGEHRTVTSDPDAALNGDYVLLASGWAPVNGSRGIPFATAVGLTDAQVVQPGAPTTRVVTFPSGRFTVKPVVTISNAISDIGSDPLGLVSITAISATQMTVRYSVAGSAAQIVAGNWTAVQMTSTSAVG